MHWSSEVVVVTGGLGGLGRLIAEVFAARGVDVAVLDLKDEDDEAVRVGELLERGIRYYQCDVGRRESVEAVKRRIEKDLAPPTILINNAAIVNGKPFLHLTPADLDRNYRVNLLSHWHTIQTFLPAMLDRAQGGTIVTVSSVLGYLGCAGLYYTSAKAGLTALHTSLRAELPLLSSSPSPSSSPSSSPPSSPSSSPRPNNIRTILVTPGQISTPLFSTIRTPSSFFGPVLDPATLCTAIVNAIDSGRDVDVALPLYSRWIGVLNVLPDGLKAVVRRVAGLDGAAWRAYVQGS